MHAVGRVKTISKARSIKMALRFRHCTLYRNMRELSYRNVNAVYSLEKYAGDR